MSLGTVHVGEQQGSDYDVDSMEVEGRADGFYAVRLNLGIGYGTYRLQLDSTAPGKWYLWFDGYITCELEDPDLVSDDTRFACTLATPTKSTLALALDPPLGGERSVRRLALEAGLAPFQARLRLELDEGTLELDEEQRWTLRSPGHEPVAEVRFAGKVRG